MTPDPASPPWTIRKGAVRLNIRLTPKARKAGVLGVQADADGLSSLKVAVNAPPENGKANAALVDALAKVLGVPKRDISLIQGETDRRKVVEITHDCDGVIARLETVLKALGP